MAEIPKIAQQTGSGIASSIERPAGVSAVGGGGAAVTGALWIFGIGAVING